MAEKKTKKETAKPEKVVPKKKDEYIYSVGRRKCATAQVRLYKKGTGKIVVNNKDYKEYFPTSILQALVIQPLETVNKKTHDISARVKGGGSKGQAEAVRHGIARALVKLSEDFRSPLKKEGLLTRDSRVKERKKPGLKRARRAPQWKKR